MNAYYDSIKPSFAPPAWLFAPVWTVLYIIIAITFTYTLSKSFRGEWPAWLTIPLLINLVANLAYIPIQFGARNTVLATADIIIVLVSLVILMIAILPYSTAIFYALLPYLAWVLFATVLQFSLHAPATVAQSS